MNNWQDDEKFVRMSSLLQKVVYQKKWQKRMEIHKVFRFWNRVVGETVAAHAQPAVIRGKTLWVEVCDSVWVQQLQYRKHELLTAINQELHPESLEDLRFQIGTLKPAVPSKKEKPETVVPDPVKKEEFEQLTQGLSNRDTRQALQKLWLAYARHKKV